MKIQALFLPMILLFAGCTGSSPTGSPNTEAPSAQTPADSTDEYYNPDYKMPPQTSWVLQRINGREVTTADIRNEVPTLQIDLIEGKARGTGGCNRYNAPVSIEGNQINFGMVMSTKVACPSLDLETAYFNILKFGMLTYQWRPHKLIIQRDVRSVLEFKPAPN